MQLASRIHLRLFSSWFTSDILGKDVGIANFLFIKSDVQRSQGTKYSHARRFNEAVPVQGTVIIVVLQRKHISLRDKKGTESWACHAFPAI